MGRGRAQGGTSLACSIFEGLLKSEVKAAKAPPSVTVEPFLELALDIVPESVFSVADALTRMTNSETLHGAHKAARAAQG